MLDQIEKIRLEATEAIVDASTSAALEDLRVRYLGRKAELTQILRGISQSSLDHLIRIGAAGPEPLLQ